MVRYNDDHGAMLVESDARMMRFSFINRQGKLIDEIELHKAQRRNATLGNQVTRSLWSANNLSWAEKGCLRPAWTRMYSPSGCNSQAPLLSRR